MTRPGAGVEAGVAPWCGDGRQWVLDIADAGNAALCGGKAVGLAKLERAGFPVPPAICVTTAFYRCWLEHAGIAPELTAVTAAPILDPRARRDRLAGLRARVEAAILPDELAVALEAGIARLREGWTGPFSVRSSGVGEDDNDASHAGIHSSFVVPDADAVRGAVQACWASLWTETAWAYRERLGAPHAAAAMAVVVQRFVSPERSGVAFSADPLTSDRATVVIEAGWGAGAPLVSGKITPDVYWAMPGEGGSQRLRRRPGRQSEMTVWRAGRERVIPVPEASRREPVLTDGQALELARLVKAVERALGTPTDVEWVFAGGRFWAVQARPITTLAPAQAAAPAETLWTRANLKEVFPDLPSPLALSYLARSLNLMFTSYHDGLGYALPPGAELVSVFRGRPYLNLTLMQQMTIARGGDPAVVARLFGGTSSASPGEPAGGHPRAATADRLRLVREMLATFFLTPHRGRRLFRALSRKARKLGGMALEELDDRSLVAHLRHFRMTLFDECTVRRLHEVVSAQSRAYMALDQLLAAWIPADSATLVKGLMTGLGTLPNVAMTYRLMALGSLAAQDPRARAFFTAELTPDAGRRYRVALAGTPVLSGLERFLREFGHRGPYESDVMSPRFSEDPAPVLQLIQLYVRAGAPEDPAQHAADRRRVRREATEGVRRALRPGRTRLAFGLRWAAFSIVRDALQRLLALRDECRHVTTGLVAHLRRVALEIGRRATAARLLRAPDDVFFLTWDELPCVFDEPTRDWQDIVLRRRAERERNARLEAPDLLRGDQPAGGEEDAAGAPTGDDLMGFGVSPGTVTGTVRVLGSVREAHRLSGEIVVFAAVEPTLTPIFPLVRGMIAEMGGLLSHAAILAREYGLPAVFSVQDATHRLHDGDRVELDGTTGRIRVLERAAGTTPAS